MSLSDQLGFVRMITNPEVRTESSGRKTLRGVFTPFNQWATIDSWEGLFRERTVPGAFKRTISQSWDSFKRVGRHAIVVNYNHGMDAAVGTRQLGSITILEEREEGPYYEVSLLDTDYNREYIVPAAEDGILGASYRFAIPKGGDTWVERTDDGIPERTITESAVYEFGPVDHPAFEAATAGVRSFTEFEWWRKLDEQGRAQYAELLRRSQDLGTFTPVKPAEPETTDDTSEASPDGPQIAPVDRQAVAAGPLRRLSLVTAPSRHLEVPNEQEIA